MKQIHLIKTLCFLMLTAFLFSCDDFKDYKDDYIEPEKNIEGTWKLDKVTRNGTDITDLMDFSRFTITFSSDNTYKIENYLPFIVKNAGSWYLDDPQYAFHIIFSENNSNTDVISGLNFIVVDGQRRISLSISPGCQQNIYTYELKRVSN